MAYQRKTSDEWRLWINYGQGWEHEVSEDTWKEMRQRLTEYRTNCPQYPVRSTGPHRVALPACGAFLLCGNPATTTIAHPVLGTVPACQRCAGKLARLAG